MFNIGFSEILITALITIVVLDKNKVPTFISFIKNIYRYFMLAKLKTRKFLKDAGVEDLYKEYSVEKVNCIFDKGTKFYSSYNIDNTSKDHDSENSGSR
ncbi:MAG: hypothetical protein LKM44_01675 [Wolbachia endosymbiont of Meromenopon meropis]|nr:hypothetical protein [Wolbachia endosymbiont of Meromenopon meropis]